MAAKSNQKWLSYFRDLLASCGFHFFHEPDVWLILAQLVVVRFKCHTSAVSVRQIVTMTQLIVAAAAHHNHHHHHQRRRRRSMMRKHGHAPFPLDSFPAIEQREKGNIYEFAKRGSTQELQLNYGRNEQAAVVANQTIALLFSLQLNNLSARSVRRLELAPGRQQQRAPRCYESRQTH